MLSAILPRIFKFKTKCLQDMNMVKEGCMTVTLQHWSDRTNYSPINYPETLTLASGHQIVLIVQSC